MKARFVYPLETILQQAIESPLENAPVLIQILDDDENHVRFIQTTWKRLMIEREIIRERLQKEGYHVTVLPKFNALPDIL